LRFTAKFEKIVGEALCGLPLAEFPGIVVLFDAI
jgi:hypothetical protein